MHFLRTEGRLRALEIRLTETRSLLIPLQPGEKGAICPQSWVLDGGLPFGHAPDEWCEKYLGISGDKFVARVLQGEKEEARDLQALLNSIPGRVRPGTPEIFLAWKLGIATGIRRVAALMDLPSWTSALSLGDFGGEPIGIYPELNVDYLLRERVRKELQLPPKVGLEEFPVLPAEGDWDERCSWLAHRLGLTDRVRELFELFGYGLKAQPRLEQAPAEEPKAEPRKQEPKKQEPRPQPKAPRAERKPPVGAGVLAAALMEAGVVPPPPEAKPEPKEPVVVIVPEDIPDNYLPEIQRRVEKKGEDPEVVFAHIRARMARKSEAMKAQEGPKTEEPKVEEPKPAQEPSKVSSASPAALGRIRGLVPKDFWPEATRRLKAGEAEEDIVLALLVKAELKAPETQAPAERQEEPKAEETKAEETKAEETKAEEQKPEEPPASSQGQLASKLRKELGQAGTFTDREVVEAQKRVLGGESPDEVRLDIETRPGRVPVRPQPKTPKKGKGKPETQEGPQVEEKPEAPKTEAAG